MTTMDARLTKAHKELKKLKPLTPLTSYNIFFLVERKRILQGTDRPDIPITIQDAQVAIQERAKSKETTRKHRKSHGRISFRDLADLIAERWKDVSNATKAMLKQEANKERVVFNQQMRIWEKLEKEILSISQMIMNTRSDHAHGRVMKDTQSCFAASSHEDGNALNILDAYGSRQSSPDELFIEKQFNELRSLIDSSSLLRRKQEVAVASKNKKTVSVSNNPTKTRAFAKRVQHKASDELLIATAGPILASYSSQTSKIQDDRNDPKKLIDSLASFVYAQEQNDEDPAKPMTYQKSDAFRRETPMVQHMNPAQEVALTYCEELTRRPCGTGIAGTIFWPSSSKEERTKSPVCILNEDSTNEEEVLAPTPLAPHVERLLSLSRQNKKRKLSSVFSSTRKKAQGEELSSYNQRNIMKTPNTVDTTGFGCPSSTKRTRVKGIEKVAFLSFAQTTDVMKYCQREKNYEDTVAPRDSPQICLDTSFFMDDNNDLW